MSNDFMPSLEDEKSNKSNNDFLGSSFQEINIPGAGFSAKEPIDPYIDFAGDFSLQDLDDQYQSPTSFSEPHDQVVDLAEKNGSQLSSKAEKEFEELNNKRRPGGKPSILRLLTSFSDQANKSYLPHHVALPILLENNKKVRNLTAKLGQQINTYELAVAQYESALVKKGFDPDVYKKEQLLPYEHRELTKKINTDPEMLRLMGIVSESHNRLRDTMQSKELSTIMQLAANNEIGINTKNDFFSMFNNIVEDRIPALQKKKCPLIDGGKNFELSDKLDAFGDELRKIAESFKNLFSFGKKKSPTM